MLRGNGLEFATLVLLARAAARFDSQVFLCLW